MTLIEVLAALAVAGLLFTLLSQGLHFALNVQRLQARDLDSYTDRSVTDRTLRGLIEHMDPGLTRATPAFFVGGPHAMEFTTELPEPAGAVTVLEADVRLEVDLDHRLVLRWSPRRGLPMAVPKPAMVPILTGVERLDIRYWRAEQGDGNWVSVWPDPILPRLIRMRIFPVSGRGRPAFDIVVAPARDRWRM